MSPVDIFLVVVAAIFLIGIVGELLFDRTGIPDVIWLILVGILIGPVTGAVDRSELAKVAPFFGALTLVVVLFDGGAKLQLRDVSTAVSRSLLLATVSFLASVLILAPAVMVLVWVGALPETWTWLHAVTVAAILGGSSSVVVMPALRRAGLSSRIANVISLESALTDVLCVVATGACVKIATTGSANLGVVGEALGKSFGIGLIVGLVAGVLSLLVLRPLRKSQYAYPIVLGALLLVYVLIDVLGGSAALGIIAMSILLGNAPQLSKSIGLSKAARLGRGVENAHDQITFIVKSFFFTFIGAMLGPPWGLLIVGVLLGLLILGARIPAVAVGLMGSDIPREARPLVVVALPRGMAAGVLAMFPAGAGMVGTEELPVVVFSAVFTTIVIFAVGFPLFRRRVVGLAGDTPPEAIADPELPRGLAGQAADASVTYGFDPPGAGTRSDSNSSGNSAGTDPESTDFSGDSEET